MKQNIEKVSEPARLWTVVSNTTGEIVSAATVRKHARTMAKHLNGRRKVRQYKVRSYTADSTMV